MWQSTLEKRAHPMRAEAARATDGLQPCGRSAPDAIPRPMNQTEGALPAKSRQSLLERVLLFVFAGPILNYLLIAGSFRVFRSYEQLPLWAVSACSIGVSAIVFFFWNYFLNFRTGSRKRHAFGRYVVAVIVLWAVTSAILYAFKTFDANMKLNLGRFSIDLDVVATQLCFGWIKFLVYHQWVFPAHSATEEA